ncbi:MAG: PDZ domain-containing protein [Nitrososphaerales archaeon]
MSKGFDEWIVPAVEKLSPSVVNISTVRLLSDYFFNVHPVSGMSATEELASYYELPVKAGVIVARIIHGSPSYKASISEGDLIVGIDGTPIKTVQDLQKIVQKRKVGDKIGVEVVRGHQMGVVEVILTELPRS